MQSKAQSTSKTAPDNTNGQGGEDNTYTIEWNIVGSRQGDPNYLKWVRSYSFRGRKTVEVCGKKSKFRILFMRWKDNVVRGVTLLEKGFILNVPCNFYVSWSVEAWKMEAKPIKALKKQRLPESIREEKQP